MKSTFYDILAQTLDDVLEEQFERKMGFALLIFEFNNQEGTADYVSNAHRDDMLRLLEETMRRLKAEEDLKRDIPPLTEQPKPDDTKH